MIIPRQYALVKFIGEIPKTIEKKNPLDDIYNPRFPFESEETYIFLGEIPNMPTHCVVAERNGKIIAGYHIENFEEVPDDET